MRDSATRTRTPLGGWALNYYGDEVVLVHPGGRHQARHQRPLAGSATGKAEELLARSSALGVGRIFGCVGVEVDEHERAPGVQ